MAAAYAALLSVMHIIDNLELHPHPPISLHKKQLHLLTQKLTYLQKFLEDYDPHLSYSTEADPLESRIADAAYAAEDAIESHIVDQITNDGGNLSSDALTLIEDVEKVIEEMALIEKEAMEIEGSVGVPHQLHRNSTPSDSLRSSSIAQKSSMVGADDMLFDLKDKLTSHCRDLQVIPIVGMGGAGKTTLAMNIYHDRLIKRHFNICAWATISQEYSIREILTQVLRQLNQEANQGLSEGELGKKLYQHLYSRKFLIVLDDMWSIDAWDGVRNYFPNDKNNSRIVVTTRLSNLASKLPDSNSLEMKLLDEDDSWELLSKTVFGEEGCPLELEEIGTKIGKSCKGLPLSIVVVGGFLGKSKHTREFWEYIEENLNSIVNLEDDERCLKILHMSYNQLPIYLKPCFLYMGVFLEDEEIRSSKLIKLWVDEGFLRPKSGKSLEETAKVYLKDLIGRNLILIHKMGSTGNIKHCKIHDLLRDLCLREAEKERFYTTTPQGIVNGGRRIIISKNEDINALSSMSRARSIMWDHEQALQPQSFKLLRIFHARRLGSSAAVEFLENVHQLVNSRFLTISSLSSGCKIPSSIWLFWNLQTLIVGMFQLKVSVPTEMWYMPHIRHIQFFYGLHLPVPPDGQDDFVLENLQTLLTIKNFKCSEQVVKRIPNIKKLKISYDRLDDHRFCLRNLDCLDKLESLSCYISQGMKPVNSLESLINFPHSLNKLSLTMEIWRCWQGALDKIGSLPLLQKLTLEWGSFKEGRWETSEGQFHSLKFLSLRFCEDLRVWTTESSNFPCLEHLHLHQADQLEEIPLEFAEISTLKVIRVSHCSDSAVESAKRILEEQEELYGEAALQVQVALWRNNKTALESLAGPNFCFV